MPKTKKNQGEYKGHATDFPLVNRALAGDPLAYEELFQKYKERILYFFLKSTRNLEDSEDLLQETFMRAFSRLTTFKKKSGFFTWLRSIAANNLYMRYRRKKLYFVPLDELRGKKMVDEDLFLQQSVRQQEESSFQKSDLGKLDSELENIPNKLSTDKLLNGLSPGYRKVLELTYLQGLNQEETALKLGCSLGNVKSQHHKAIRRLHAMC